MTLRADVTVMGGELTVSAALSVAPGETLAIVGPNGAGKSTLLRALAGLVPLTSGTVTLDDRVLEDVAAGRRLPPEDRSVGVVFQDLRLFDDLDVVDNVAFGLRAGGRRRGDARSAAIAWLGQLGVDGARHTAVRSLSGGEAQRVALARALAPAPRALLLDEPLSALDAEVRPRVRRELRAHLGLHDGPCILVTHDPLDAAVLADRVLVLEAGRVTGEGTLAELVARPRSSWAADLAGTNLLPATARDGLLHLDAGGSLRGADPVADGRVLVAIRPSSVTLHRGHPEGSARNVWAATVVEVEGYAERARVEVAGEVGLVAEVTTTAVRELGLHSGVQVWVSVKATEVVAYPA